MSKVCEKHKEKPARIYSQCIGCEVESLNGRIKELEEERSRLIEWIKTALVGAMKESCLHDTTDPTWHCCDWGDLVEEAKSLGLES